MKAPWPVFALSLVAACFVVAPPPAVTPAGGPTSEPIQIVAGTYGANCGQPRGNVSAHLAATCNGRGDCAYKVDYRVIGDPAVGCPKTYVAEWTCGSSPELLRAEAAPEAGYGSVLQLVCAGGGYPKPPVASAPPPPEPPSPPIQPAPPPMLPPAPPPGDRVPPAPPSGGRIHVIAGSYGQNCRAPRGNKTEHLHRSCEGHHTCAYRIDHKVIGDPAYGCGKDYVAEWQCGRAPAVYRAMAAPEAGYGSIVTLACDGSVSPGR